MKDLNTLKTTVGDAVKDFADRSGKAANEIATELSAFLAEVEPLIEEQSVAAIAGDQSALEGLGYLTDAALVRAGRTLQAFSESEKLAFASLVTTVIRAAIAFA